MLKYLAVLFMVLYTTQALLKDEMDMLEKELADAHMKADAKKNSLDELLSKANTQQKKSLDDMTTEELIDELKKEVNAINHHDTFRSKFDQIVETKKKDDEEKLWVKSLNMMADNVFKRAALSKKNVGCVDERSDCEDLKDYCVTHKEKIGDSCRKTCNYCNCLDKISSCDRLKNGGVNQCDMQRERMAEFCPKTCGFCKPPAPPKCSKTRHGCCWDKETIKTTSDGANCPACRDQYRYVCKTFKLDCKNLRSSGTFMRMHCPNSCELCGEDCKDAADRAFYCKLWDEQLDYCNNPEQRENMRHFCPKTCNLC